MTIGQAPVVVQFTAVEHEMFAALDGQAKAARWMMVNALMEINHCGLHLIKYPTFADYLREEIGIGESTYRQWKRSWDAFEYASIHGAILANQYAARALCETEQAARETVCRMAAAKAGDRPINARDIRNAANALMEAMDNVAAGDDVEDLPELAQQSQHEAGMRTSANIDKAQGWVVFQWRAGDKLPDELQVGQVYEIKFRRVSNDATS